MFESEPESESAITQSTAKRAVAALSIIAAALVIGVAAGVYLYLARHSVPSCGSEDATQLVQRILSDSLAKQLPSSKGEVIGRAIKFSFDMIEKGELSSDGNVRKCSARLNVTVADEMLRKPLDAPVDARWRQLYDEESKKLLAPIKYELRALDDKESSFLAEVAASEALSALNMVLTTLARQYEPQSQSSSTEPNAFDATPAVAAALSSVAAAESASASGREGGGQLEISVCQIVSDGRATSVPCEVVEHEDGTFVARGLGGASLQEGLLELAVVGDEKSGYEMRGVTQGGVDNRWGEVKRDDHGTSCWTGRSFRVCVRDQSLGIAGTSADVRFELQYALEHPSLWGQRVAGIVVLRPGQLIRGLQEAGHIQRQASHVEDSVNYFDVTEPIQVFCVSVLGIAAYDEEDPTPFSRSPGSSPGNVLSIYVPEAEAERCSELAQVKASACDTNKVNLEVANEFERALAMRFGPIVEVSCAAASADE